MCLVVLLCADSATVARVDIETLSQQTLFELLVQHISGKQTFCLPFTTDFRPLHEWAGIVADDDGNVHTIQWQGKPTEIYNMQKPNIASNGGSIDLKFLPSTVCECSIVDLNLNGTIDTSNLPRGLTALQLNDNSLNGPFDVHGLPRGIETIDITANKFSGSLDISSLPPKLEKLQASDNSFSGTLDFTNLPDLLANIDLQINGFTGTIDLTKLPPSIRCVALGENKITQKELRVGFPKAQFEIFDVDWDKYETVRDINGAKMRFQAPWLING